MLVSERSNLKYRYTPQEAYKAIISLPIYKTGKNRLCYSARNMRTAVLQALPSKQQTFLDASGLPHRDVFYALDLTRWDFNIWTGRCVYCRKDKPWHTKDDPIYHSQYRRPRFRHDVISAFVDRMPWNYSNFGWASFHCVGCDKKLREILKKYPDRRYGQFDDLEVVLLSNLIKEKARAA